ncbi:MAG TPA: organomercurial lyase [Sedimentisphaerales bacterium]|nr:organomercurial lyase [Sedimentisphaerales bacterium]
MNKVGKIGIVVVLIVAVVVVIAVKSNKSGQGTAGPGGGQQIPAEYMPEQLTGKGLPALIDVGAGICIPCKLMAPILEELKEELQGKITVQFLDLNKYPGLADIYRINIQPTQIFYDASGKELFRHEAFYSKEDILGKWKELGVDLTTAEPPAFERLTPAKVDSRPKDSICYMCDGDINPKTLVTVQTDKGAVRLCSPHCYFIMYSCLTEDKSGFENKVSVTDWAADKLMPAASAIYLYALDSQTGRPTVKAFAEAEKARAEQETSGGNIIDWTMLQEKELAARCGFCDRAVYPEDAAVVRAAGVYTWGCCSHCALGVAARTGLDIEIHEHDRLTAEEIVVRTLNGSVASLEPATAVAWFGQRKKPDGTWGSAGCFHQGFFVNADNLKKWVEQNPYETGRLISISQALADKMKLSAEQIKKACKIGECAPK